MSVTIYNEVSYTLGNLIDNIHMGVLGLPELQRPFVWKNAHIRDLFDSMYKGYPVGHLLFWQSGVDESFKAIGVDKKQKAPSLLIVDGQQRLTSLYAVLKGIPVIRDNYETEVIEIAFNPLNEEFAVADAAIRRDPTFLPNISSLWSIGPIKTINAYTKKLNESRVVSEEEEAQIEKGLSRLNDLHNYPFRALELLAGVSDEHVSDVFVRINSKGKKLNQADFILTLMSVFWDEGRTEMEAFCQAARKPTDKGKTSPYNHYIHPDPDHLLRVSVAIGFKRARLKYVYSILRGKNLESGEYSNELREKQFGVLKAAQKTALNLTYWHDYLNTLNLAGYKSKKVLSSGNSIIFTYALYLMGRMEYGVDAHILKKSIARWFFMVNITSRYSSSPDSTFEFDLARFREVTNKEDYVAILNRVCEDTLTNDFWEVTLPNDLATSAAKSPSLNAFFAALNMLEAMALFSEQKVSDLQNPTVVSSKSALERHHLFPKDYLKKNGFSSTREYNQNANFTLLEWGDNGNISNKPPKEYLPVMEKRFSLKDIAKMYDLHALPVGWAEMKYPEFLEKRRELMAKVIRRAWEEKLSLKGKEKENGAGVSISSLIESGESIKVEFKATLRTNLHTGKPDSRMELAILRTIAGFLNSQNGGNLLIGVADDGQPVGLEADKFENEDKMDLHLGNLIKDRLGAHFSMYIHPRFEDYMGQRALAVECWPSKSPVYVKDGDRKRFYVRNGASSSELDIEQAQEYIKRRYG